MATYTPKLMEILRAHGRTYERPGRGDHEIWYSPITERRSPVDHKILSRRTANAILKQAGIEVDHFLPPDLPLMRRSRPFWSGPPFKRAGQLMKECSNDAG